MKYFWSLAENKENFQQFFIKWLIENYDIGKPVYLGGGHPADPCKCICLTDQGCKDYDRLTCNHEEVDDRLFYHINEGIRTCFFILPKFAVFKNPKSEICF